MYGLFVCLCFVLFFFFFFFFAAVILESSFPLSDFCDLHEKCEYRIRTVSAVMIIVGAAGSWPA